MFGKQFADNSELDTLFYELGKYFLRNGTKFLKRSLQRAPCSAVLPTLGLGLPDGSGLQARPHQQKKAPPVSRRGPFATAWVLGGATLELAADQFLHDLAGAAEDARDACAAPGAGNRILVHIACSAV